jgi:hypothetical protein
MTFKSHSLKGLEAAASVQSRAWQARDYGPGSRNETNATLKNLVLRAVCLLGCFSSSRRSLEPIPMKKISACPGWLDLSEDRRSFILVAEKAEIVRRIFKLSIGGLGSYSIAKRLP